MAKQAQPLTVEGLGVLLLLQLITEDRMAAGTDLDGSMTTGRALEILGGWDRMAGQMRRCSLPVSGKGAERRARLRQLLATAEPVLSRTARITPRS